MKRGIKRGTVLLVSYLLAAAVCCGVLAGREHARAAQWERSAVNGYQRAFGQLVTAVGEVDSALQKSLYATSPGMSGAICAEIFGKSLSAKAAVSALPFQCQELERTDGFLSRVGDYAFSLSRGALAGRALTPEERETLRGLSQAAEVLSLNLKELQSGIQDGSLSLTELSGAGEQLEQAGDARQLWVGDQLSLIEREFPEVPSLIYDGPFSEHLTGRAPRALEGQPEVDEDAARRAAAEFLGLVRSRVYATGEIAGDLPCYGMAADDEGGTVYLSVTKQGGRVLGMLSSRPVGYEAVAEAQALETARNFLAEAGYTDMAETYHMRRNGVLTVNYAWRQGDVICYSDLVKVSVALDNGRVCGFEARGYLTCHTQRELPEIAVDAVQAAATVPEDLEILAVQTALVPSDGQYETLCHEFKCADAEGRHCILYVNVQTGQQEKILLLLEDETGTLTL